MRPENILQNDSTLEGVTERSPTAREPLRMHWDRVLEKYVRVADWTFEASTRLYAVSLRTCRESPLVQPGSSSLIKLTLGALCVVFVLILFSCQTAPAPLVRRPPRQEGMELKGSRAMPQRAPDTLYLKQKTSRIVPREKGSRTGSIWADSGESRGLFADARPTRTGDVLAVNIPPELQFVPPAKDEKKKQGEKTSGDKKDSDENGKSAEKSSALELAPEIPEAPVTSLKMEIVGFETNGDALVRGRKNYRNAMGETDEMTLVGRVPKRALLGFELDARELVDLELESQTNGQPSTYSTSGWDTTLSRRMSGYRPDVDAGLAALEDARREIEGTRATMKEQARALSEERDRLRKDRARLNEAMARASGQSDGGKAREPSMGMPRPPGTGPASAANASGDGTTPPQGSTPPPGGNTRSAAGAAGESSESPPGGAK